MFDCKAVLAITSCDTASRSRICQATEAIERLAFPTICADFLACLHLLTNARPIQLFDLGEWYEALYLQQDRFTDSRI
jgi:hypothetical protein